MSSGRGENPRDHKLTERQLTAFQGSLPNDLKLRLFVFARDAMDPNIDKIQKPGHWLWTRDSFIVNYHGERINVKRMALALLSSFFLPKDAEVETYCKHQRCLLHLRLKT